MTARRHTVENREELAVTGCPFGTELDIGRTSQTWALGRVCSGCGEPVRVVVEHVSTVLRDARASQEAEGIVVEALRPYDIPTGAWTEKERAEPAQKVVDALAAAGYLAVHDARPRTWLDSDEAAEMGQADLDRMAHDDARSDQ